MFVSPPWLGIFIFAPFYPKYLTLSIVPIAFLYLGIGNTDMAKGELTIIPLLSLLTVYFGIYGICTLLPGAKAISAVATSRLLIMCIHAPIFWFVHLYFFDIFPIFSYQ